MRPPTDSGFADFVLLVFGMWFAYEFFTRLLTQGF